MITIIHCYSGVTIEGHANYAEPGKDIVCAAVSALTQTFIESVEELTADKIKYTITEGKAVIAFRNLSEKAQTLLNSFFIGLKMIANEYPANVQILPKP